MLDWVHVYAQGLTSCAVLAAMSLEVTMSCSNLPSPETTLSAASLDREKEEEKENKEAIMRKKKMREEGWESKQIYVLTQEGMLPNQLV